MRSDNCRTERTKGKARNFEKLLSEGNSDDRDAQQNADQEITQSQHPSADQEPGNIQQEGNGLTFITNFFAEGVQGNARQFKALQSDRYTDYRYAPQATCSDPPQGTDQASENDPQDISQNSHLQTPSFLIVRSQNISLLFSTISSIAHRSHRIITQVLISLEGSI